MSLDIRIPTGLLFGIIGLILVCFGLFSDPAIYERSLNWNINVIWGGVLLAFGLGMLYLARRAREKKA